MLTSNTLGDVRRGADEYAVDVLRQEGGLLASFVCPVEAFRFAVLIHEPGRAVLLRRRTDCSVRAFSAASETTDVLTWLSAGP